MMLWIVLTVMTVVVAVAAAAPFLREPPHPGADTDTGTETATGRPEPAKPSTASAYGVAGLLALAATLLYASLGRPDLQSRPQMQPLQTARQTTAPAGDAVDDLARYVQDLEGAAEGTGTPAPGTATGLAPVDEMTERLAQRLDKNPQDLEGWRMLGWSYASQERYSEAAEAYARAIALDPKDAALKTARGEALVEAAHGRIDDQSKLLFEETLARDPENPKASYYLGRHALQSGDKKAAIEIFLKVLAGMQEKAPWVMQLRADTIALAREAGVDITSRLPAEAGESAPPEADPAAAAAQDPNSGPTAQDVRRAEAMTDTDRAAMINAMVDRLESRLKTNPRDVEGWIKLMRSRQVLGDGAAARAVRDRALAIFASDEKERGAIAAAARDLGIEEGP